MDHGQRTLDGRFVPSMRAFILVGLSVLIQVVIGRAVSSPWFVPDVALALLVVMMARLRARRLELAAFAALLAALFSMRHPVLVAGAYLAVAACVGMLGSMWDLAEPSLLRLAVGAAETLWLLACLAADRGTISMMGFVGVRVFLTLMCLPVLKKLSGLVADA